MEELNARFRVAGLTDAQAQELPTPLDGPFLQRMELSTWRTDAGDFDVLAEIPDRRGDRLRYEDLAPRALTFDVTGHPIRVAALSDVIASKEWPTAPRTTRPSPSCGPSATPSEAPSSACDTRPAATRFDTPPGDHR